MTEIVKYDTLAVHLDWNRIKLAVRGTDEEKLMFSTASEGNAVKMVERALRRWGPRDYATMEIAGIEEHFEFYDDDVKEGRIEEIPIAHGYIDLRLILRNEWKQLAGPMLNQTFILDWKSTRSALDASWADRLRKSWQWKLYAAATGTKYMIYRGIHVKEGAGSEREEILALPPIEDLQAIVVHQWRHYRKMLWENERQVESDHPSWSRHMPYACGAYAHKCPYTDDCETQTSPFVLISPEILSKPISYSSGERLALCPERHRRYLINQHGLDLTRGKVDDLDETEETLVGSAFHRGMQEAYTQMKNMKETGVL